MILTGTIVNSAAIVAGSIAGLLLGKFIPERFSDAMEKGAALCVLYIGVDGMLAGENTLVAILSIAIGAILGSAIPLTRALGEPWQYAVLAGATLLLFVARRGVVTTLLVAGAVGAVLALAGAPLPR